MRTLLRAAPARAALVAFAAACLTGCGGADMAPPQAAMSPRGEVTEEIATRGMRRESAGDKDARNTPDEARPEPPPPPPPPPAPGFAAGIKQPKPPADGAPPGAAEVASARAPMLIYTADITMAVFEVNAALGRLEALGKEVGGFVAKRTNTSITIRVPAARFDEAVKRVEAAGDMIHKNVVAEDVTEEFRDLEVRLKTMRQVRDRLAELLSKAVKVEESLMIERELDRVVGDIERLEGRMKFLRDRASFSTITVTFQAKPKETVGSGPSRLPGKWLYDLGLRRLLSI